MTTTTSRRGDYDNLGRLTTAVTISTFAGVMLLTMAVLQVLQGISAVANDAVFVKGINYTYKFDVTTWGWIHITLGALCIATAIGILASQAWGQLGGIALAGLSVVTNFAFLPYYPLWALVLIAFNVVVIWALCTQITSDRPD